MYLIQLIKGDSKMKTVMWFRRDLRLKDNKALYHALKNVDSKELILIFQVNPQQFIKDSPNCSDPKKLDFYRVDFSTLFFMQFFD